MPKYFLAFRSCNVSLRAQTDSWCGHCAKCLAIYIGLYPFVELPVLDKIFGKRLLEDKDLLVLARDVLGEGQGKPFECIGTFEETLAAFSLCLDKIDGQEEPILLTYFRQDVLPKCPNLKKTTLKILSAWGNDQNLPGNYRAVLKKAYENS